ncbi:MAG: hypothetical protein PHZ25_01925 [Candidatus Pacebacteria bacterium]|nr:hypothetical protein [Candidatus Paceibacterota bacterium]
MLKINSEKKRKRRIAIIAIITILFIGLVYVVFLTDFFKVKRIEVVGNKTVSEEEIKNAFNFSYIFWSVEEKRLPVTVREAKVIKSFLKREVLIETKEREPFALWCFNKEGIENCRWFDETGFIFMDSPLTKGAFIKSIRGDREVEIGNFVMEENLFKNLKEILDIFERNRISVLKFETGDLKNEELTAYVGNLPIFFSLREDPSFTEEALNTLKSKFSSLSYIDLRSEGKVFYK